MSRTKKVTRGSGNPVQISVNARPNSGMFVMYNRSTKEKQEVATISLLILDADRSSVSGYSSDYDTGYVSNLVMNTKKEEFKVGVFDNGSFKLIAEGLYQDIKKDLSEAHYTKNVFGLIKNDEGVYEIARLELVGRARSAFFDWFAENEDEAYEGVVEFSFSKQKYKYVKKDNSEKVVTDNSKATTNYHKLLITINEADDEDIEAADANDIKLQTYFKGTGAASKEESGSNESQATGTAPSAPEDSEEEDKDDLPF